MELAVRPALTVDGAWLLGTVFFAVACARPGRHPLTGAQLSTRVTPPGARCSARRAITPYQTRRQER